MSEAAAGSNLQGSMPQWEYRVIHIDASKGTPPTPPDPKVASEKLGGTLSPEFISREFPHQYGPQHQSQASPKHPAEQLQYFLNLLGRQGWELANTAQVEHLLMFIFKRPLRALPKLIAPADDSPSHHP